MSFAISRVGLFSEWPDNTHARPTGTVFGENSEGQDQYQKLEPPLSCAFRAIHRELVGLSVRFLKSYFDMRLWGFIAATSSSPDVIWDYSDTLILA